MPESTRRAVLTSLGTLGFLGVGTASSRATADRDHSVESPASTDSPFANSSDLESFVDDVLADRIGEEVPGASVAVVEDGDVVLAKGYGYADVDAETPVEASETTFEVGSVGKTVTWSAVMQAVQNGSLELDEDVDTYLEDSAVSIPETYDSPITLRHLGTHTAGFESALDPSVVDDPNDLTSLETVLVENRPARVRPPGEAVGYSNYGAALAGHVVAEVHDTTFEEYVRSEIFEPLGMTHSTFAQPVPDGHPGTPAASHTGANGEFDTVDPVYVNMGPAGSMTATVTDVATFVRAHLGGGAVGDARILGSDTVTTMHSRHFERHPAVTNWRYGWYEYGHPDADVLAHSGGTIYHESKLVLAPTRGVGIFVNYNRRTDDEASGAVVDELLEGYGLLPNPSTPEPTSESGSRQRAELVADEYRFTMVPQSGPLKVVDALFRVSVEVTDDGNLRTESLDRDSQEWIETEPYVYEAREGHDVLAFDVENGAVTVMHESSTPQNTYTPVPVHERQAVTGGVIGASLAGFSLSLLGWGGHGVYRRWRRRRSATEASVIEESPDEGIQITEAGAEEESDEEGAS